MQRRGFLGAILAAGMAPAFVGAKVLMPVKTIILPDALETEPFPFLPHHAYEEMRAEGGKLRVFMEHKNGLGFGDRITIAGRANPFDPSKLQEFIVSGERQGWYGLKMVETAPEKPTGKRIANPSRNTFQRGRW